MKIYVTYAINSYQGNNYSVVEAETEAECHKIIKEVTENKYAFTYKEETDFFKQIAKYGLSEIPLQPNLRWDN